MTVTVKLKGPWSPDNTDIDKAHTYYKDKYELILYDNDYGLNKRSYPLENVARIDTK